MTRIPPVTPLAFTAPHSKNLPVPRLWTNVKIPEYTDKIRRENSNKNATKDDMKDILQMELAPEEETINWQYVREMIDDINHKD